MFVSKMGVKRKIHHSLGIIVSISDGFNARINALTAHVGGFQYGLVRFADKPGLE
jgi:hypothetical protein